MFDDDLDDDPPDLGECCACGVVGPAVRNILMLDTVAPTPGKGWGCFACSLPQNGALAVVCDTCLDADAPLRHICLGWPGVDGRIARDRAPTTPFTHNRAYHPEEYPDA